MRDWSVWKLREPSDRVDDDHVGMGDRIKARRLVPRPRDVKGRFRLAAGTSNAVRLIKLRPEMMPRLVIVCSKRWARSLVLGQVTGDCGCKRADRIEPGLPTI